MYRKRHRANVRLWAEKIYVPEKNKTLSEKLSFYLSKNELDYVLTKNKATAVLYLQSKHIKRTKGWRIFMEICIS